MKKLAAIFLLLNFLFASTEAHQLLKLPLVFEHYAEHRKEDRNMSFLEFLVMHYLSGSPRDADYERDMQLPFKTHGDTPGSSTHTFVPLMVVYQCSPPPATELPVLRPAATDDLSPAGYHSGIWQPPRIS